jgi:antitoxin PrlF
MLVAISKVTSQGQISVPAEVRKELGIRPGTELVWDRMENGAYMVRPKRATLADVHAILGPPVVHLTDEQLLEARHEFLGRRSGRAGKRKG